MSKITSKNFRGINVPKLETFDKIIDFLLVYMLADRNRNPVSNHHQKILLDQLFGRLLEH